MIHRVPRKTFFTQEELDLEIGEEGFKKFWDKFTLWFSGPGKTTLKNINDHLDYIHKYNDKNTFDKIVQTTQIRLPHTKDIEDLLYIPKEIIEYYISIAERILPKGNWLDAFDYPPNKLFDIPEAHKFVDLWKKLLVDVEFDPGVYAYVDMNFSRYNLKYIPKKTTSLANLGIKSISDLDKLVSELNKIDTIYNTLVKKFDKLVQVLLMPEFPIGFDGNKNDAKLRIKINIIRLAGFYNCCYEAFLGFKEPYLMTQDLVVKIKGKL